MSYSKNKGNNALKKKYEIYSQLNDANLISYNEDDEESKFYLLMKKGYEEMASINSELAEFGVSSELKNTIEYETWLFGV
ncbi:MULTISPECIES: hypothetical protein [Clostridium]|jgi:hypothetical protein|uniref:Uncharacterized protein n=1 Tax=Clostridium manihotivorum TaxID=2320868 RepID=A0A3R5U8R9_9CLOT|nr:MULTISPECIES: hypothetical protein [Clostridium]QAA35003.1 hypothetical protein C1I91_27020 [Clostridium manihotivorum]